MTFRRSQIVVSLLMLVFVQGLAWADSWRDGRGDQVKRESRDYSRDRGRYEWRGSKARESHYRNERTYPSDRRRHEEVREGPRQERRYEQDKQGEGASREYRRDEGQRDTARSFSADDAARIAQRRYGGRVLRVERLDEDGSRYRVKLLSRDRRVRQVIVDAGG